MKEPNKTSPYWTLTFQRGEFLTDAGPASVLTGIASLDAVSPNNNWLTLNKYSAGGALLGFAQTAAMTDGFVDWKRFPYRHNNC